MAPTVTPVSTQQGSVTPGIPDDARYGAFFGTAVGRFSGRYARFRGRASRSGHLRATLFVNLACWGLVVGAGVVGAGVVGAGVLALAPGSDSGDGVFVLLGLLLSFLLAVIVPVLSLSVRRLRDAGLPPLLVLLNLVPSVGSLIVFILCCLPTATAPSAAPRPAGVARGPQVYRRPPPGRAGPSPSALPAPVRAADPGRSRTLGRCTGMTAFSLGSRPRRSTRLAAPAAALALLLTGCGTAAVSPDVVAVEAPAVRAAEDVFVGDPVVEPGPDGVTATLLVTTDVDMACAVVFGTTPDLGAGIASDSDMGGGAHRDHQAVMAGLEPDTVYYYRVQGSGADGHLYRSELRQFQTLPTPEGSEPPGPNLALEATVVEVSSEFSDSFTAEQAVDGDISTEWSSAGDGDDAAITLDLGEPAEIVGVALRSRSMSDGTAVIETYTVTVDGTEHGPFAAGASGQIHPLAATGQLVTVAAETTTGGNTGAAEIEIFGAG